MEKKYSSVNELLKDVSTDAGFHKNVQEKLENNQLSKALFAMRCAHNLTQQAMAKKLGVSQGKVSKIEHSDDIDLSMNDIISYCTVLNMSVEIGFVENQVTIVDRIRHHFSQLKKLLDDLQEMAKGDEKMEQGVEKFTKEAFVNISFVLLDCLKKAKTPAKHLPVLHVTETLGLHEELQVVAQA